MLSILLLTAISALPQDPVDQDAEVEVQVEEISAAEAIAQLKEIMGGKDYVAQAATLEIVGVVPDKKVVKEVAKALKSKDQMVQLAAITALRYNTDPYALKELLKQKKNKKIVDVDELAEEYFYALGQHGNKDAVDVLSSGVWSTAKNSKIIQARILSLGHIRHIDSCEALMDLMKSTGGRRGNNMGGRATEFRMAMCVLTGEDKGGNSTSWITWWNDAKKSLKISEEEWPLWSKNLQRKWTTLWATPEEQEEARRKQREKRGSKDGEEDKAKGDKGGDDGLTEDDI